MSLSEDLPPYVVVGGGAAGYFAAIRLAALGAGRRVILLEATRQVLTKVKISGGGRCNVTHHCFEPAKLVENYPRGARELHSCFTRFQPRDTVAWFAARGVALKVEADGRMFPTTDDSRTIVDALELAARQAGVDVRLGASLQQVEPEVPGSGSLGTGGTPRFKLRLKDGQELAAAAVLLATGSSPVGLQLAAAVGHQIEPHAPSLFTFNVKDQRLADLAGVAFAQVRLHLVVAGSKGRLERTGPLLITHWGLSGPAVLKLSAFGASLLQASAYQAELSIAFLPHLSSKEIQLGLRQFKLDAAKRSVVKNPPFTELPRRFWQQLLMCMQVRPELVYADLDKDTMQRLVFELSEGRYLISGKGIFKDEFVSAGGVRLKEVDFRHMESRIVPGLYFAGEVLALDGITGGFNFQAAWTTAWIAATAMVAADAQS